MAVEGTQSFEDWAEATYDALTHSERERVLDLAAKRLGKCGNRASMANPDICTEVYQILQQRAQRAQREKGTRR